MPYVEVKACSCSALTSKSGVQAENTVCCDMQATLEYFRGIHKLHTYKYIIFLNSSVRGPFYPSFMPAGWQWPDAFVSRLSSTVRLVASSIVCLPAEDAGGYGPKVEH